MIKRIGKDIKAYGLVLGIILLVWGILTLCFGTACVWVFLTGLPCPGCGMGHALFAVLTGAFEQAWKFNPSIWIWLLFGMSFFLYKYVLGKKSRWWGWILAIVALVMVAIYAYRMVHLFPGEPPLTYYEGNLLEKIRPEYKSLLEAIFSREL